MKQTTFADSGFEIATKKTRKWIFLEQMNSDGHFKFPQAGRFNYGVSAASRLILAAASFSR
jgi:hypothetical protein